MSKRKADTQIHAPSLNGSKKVKHEPSNLLHDSDSASSSDEAEGGAKLEGFKINEDYAKRFEHNKKREELAKLEEKYQKTTMPIKGQYGDKYDEDSETSSTDEDEDDDGFLATEALDAEISATLQALRSKDPRVYDEKVTFYAPIEEETGTAPPAKKEKPMYLNDYHRENLLRGDTGAEEEETAPRTFAQEQEDLKKTIVKEMHEAGSSSEEDEDGGFLVPKSKPATNQDVHPSRAAKMKPRKVEVDVEAADKDPETFLSNFMSARAWLPTQGARFQPLESDDEEDEVRAEKFESAYNLRFEDPAGSNEVLKSYARDVIASKTVRREEPNSRKKQRDAIREKKDAEKAERDEDRARLRRLKIEEMEGKLQKIKKAAGINGKLLKDEDWTKFLDDGWEDDKWEEEMNKRFGEEYYAAPEAGSSSDEEEAADGASKNKKKKKKQLKKPKWDDDIDIKDLVPTFSDSADEKPVFTLTDSEGSASGSEANSNSDDSTTNERQKKKTSKDHQRTKALLKKASRLERRKIETLVDNQLDITLPNTSTSTSRPQIPFRYRETSPTSFGLTARDILLAPDSQLNAFAGLKKMATFRDAEKKRKDRKFLGKKARLREWRRETFGNEDGPPVGVGLGGVEDGEDGEKVKKKKKRSRKGKAKGKVDGGVEA